MRELAAPHGARPVEAELVGLVPEAALDGYPPDVPIRGFDPDAARDREAAGGRRTPRDRLDFRRWPRPRGSAAASTAGPRAGASTDRRARPRNRAGGEGAGPRRAAGAADRADVPPTWRSAIIRGVVAAVIFFVLLAAALRPPVGAALALGGSCSPSTSRSATTSTFFIWRRARAGAERAREKSEPLASTSRCSPSARSPRTPSSFAATAPTAALIVDPGDEAERILGALEELGVKLEAILLTHTHFDHIGAVAPVAKATGAPV